MPKSKNNNNSVKGNTTNSSGSKIRIKQGQLGDKTSLTGARSDSKKSFPKKQG